MKIAIEGCAHGDLDKIYGTLQHMEKVENIKIDLLICCGDFQAVRNESDMETIACPPKYREMKDFWKYYSGVAEAPYLTLFIGGNHEASAHLWELYHGGWVAPRIYFLGFAGVVRFGNVRIAGLSGIYKSRHYHSGYFEKLPYNESDLRSIYHIREYEVNRLMQIRDDVDIFLSHDWPTGITSFGNVAKLISQKPFLKREIEDGSLGSPAGESLLKHMQPKYYFSAHMHVKFSALVNHGKNKTTKFLALDKCLPRREFLQVVDFPDSEEDNVFYYDEEWLSITRAFSPFFPHSQYQQKINFDSIDMKVHRNFVSNIFKNCEKKIPDNFCMTAYPHVQKEGREQNAYQLSNDFSINESESNPQTQSFCTMLEINSGNFKIKNENKDNFVIEGNKRPRVEKDENEIDIGEDDAEDNENEI